MANSSIEDILLRLANYATNTPDENTIQDYLGQFESCYLGYASNQKYRTNAASGGLVSTVLIYLLEKNIIEGALISRLIVKDRKIVAESFIARSPHDILSSQSSIYMEVPMMMELRNLNNIPGNIAVVGLPCDLSILKKYETRYPDLAKKIKLRIGLVCARNSKKSLMIQVLKKKGISEKEISMLRFRQGHWRGQTHITSNTGKKIIFPFQDFSIYRNLHFNCEMKCLYCEDPLGENADLVCGDGWLPELKNRPIKHSVCISRNPKSSQIIDQMNQENYLNMELISPEMFFLAQRRTIIPMKRGAQAKIRLSRYFGYRMKQGGSFKSHWNDYIVAFMILINYRLSTNNIFNKLLFMIPKPLLRLYLFAMSFLKNF